MIVKERRIYSVVQRLVYVHLYSDETARVFTVLGPLFGEVCAEFIDEVSRCHVHY